MDYHSNNKNIAVHGIEYGTTPLWLLDKSYVMLVLKSSSS